MIRSFFVVFACMLCVSAAPAQEPAHVNGLAPIEGVSASENPDLWVYLQEQRRYDDPRTILRENAAQRAAQRRSRIESQKWYGMSPLRPAASPIPSMGEAAPHWIGNGGHPYHWTTGAAFYTLHLYR